MPAQSPALTPAATGRSPSADAFGKAIAAAVLPHPAAAATGGGRKEALQALYDEEVARRHSAAGGEHDPRAILPTAALSDTAR